MDFSSLPPPPLSNDEVFGLTPKYTEDVPKKRASKKKVVPEALVPVSSSEVVAGDSSKILLCVLPASLHSLFDEICQSGAPLLSASLKGKGAATEKVVANKKKGAPRGSTSGIDSWRKITKEITGTDQIISTKHPLYAQCKAASEAQKAEKLKAEAEKKRVDEQDVHV